MLIQGGSLSGVNIIPRHSPPELRNILKGMRFCCSKRCRLHPGLQPTDEDNHSPLKRPGRHRHDYPASIPPVPLTWPLPVDTQQP